MVAYLTPPYPARHAAPGNVIRFPASGPARPGLP
jgi:hypothetical protein